MSAWAQEYGCAGQDSKQAHACILYSNDDTQHVGYWAHDVARQQRSSGINSSAKQFSILFICAFCWYNNYIGKKFLLEPSGEESDETVSKEIAVMHVRCQQSLKGISIENQNWFY